MYAVQYDSPVVGVDTHVAHKIAATSERLGTVEIGAVEGTRRRRAVFVYEFEDVHVVDDDVVGAGREGMNEWRW